MQNDNEEHKKSVLQSDWLKIVFAIFVQATALAGFIATLSNDVKYLLRDLAEMKAEVRALSDFRMEASAQMRTMSSIEARVNYLERKLESKE